MRRCTPASRAVACLLLTVVSAAACTSGRAGGPLSGQSPQPGGSTVVPPGSAGPEPSPLRSNVRHHIRFIAIDHGKRHIASIYYGLAVFTKEKHVTHVTSPWHDSADATGYFGNADMALGSAGLDYVTCIIMVDGHVVDQRVDKGSVACHYVDPS